MWNGITFFPPKIDRSLWFEIYYRGRFHPERSDFGVINLGGARGPIRNGFHFRSSRWDKVKLSLEPRMNIRSVQIIQKISQSAIFFYLLLEMIRFCHRIISTCRIRFCKFLNDWSSTMFLFFPILIPKFLPLSIYLPLFNLLLHRIYLLIKIFKINCWDK